MQIGISHQFAIFKPHQDYIIMKVYLTSTPEFSSEVLTEVALILGRTPGELEFILSEPLTAPEYGLKSPKMNSIETIENLSFDEFFSLCDTYRIIKHIPNDAFVVLITSIKNHKDWFSAFNKKNIFIHGLEWEYYTKRDAKFGIAYQVLENIFQSQIDLNINNVDSEPNIHMESIGCINDMCMNKKDVMLKLRVAEICESCVDRAIERNVNPLVLQHIQESIDRLRNEFVNSYKMTSAPLVVHIDPKRSIKIGERKFEIVALQKVLFIFFLKNIQGVETRLVCDHQDELIKLYTEIRKSGVKEKIQRMFEPEKGADPSFDSHKSKLNKALVSLLGPKLAEFYIITKVEIQDRRNIYKINLDEDYIKIDPIN
jgi:hypothetical protein